MIRNNRPEKVSYKIESVIDSIHSDAYGGKND